MVVMDWDKLRPVLQEIAPASLPSYKNLRGTILWNGQEIFEGMKLGTVLSLAPISTPTRESGTSGRRRTFAFAANGKELCEHLPGCSASAHCRRRAGGWASSLSTQIGKGNYWFKSEKSLLTARTESLASLESLADEPGEILAPEDRETAARLYHLISDMLEHRGAASRRYRSGRTASSLSSMRMSSFPRAE